MIILFRSKADFRSKHKRTNNTLICLPKCEQLELTVVYRVYKANENNNPYCSALNELPLN